MDVVASALLCWGVLAGLAFTVARLIERAAQRREHGREHGRDREG